MEAWTMTSEASRKKSLWLDGERRSWPAYDGRLAEYDVAVIGGGITGLAATYFLALRGKRVALFEKDRLGTHDTGHTTAHLAYVTDARLRELCRRFSDESVQLVWHAGATAIDTIEQIAQRERIDCDFHRVPGYLHASLMHRRSADDRQEERELQEDAELAHKLGFEAARISHVPVFDRPGIRFADQALFHPLKFLSGLAAAAAGRGADIFERSEMTEAQDDPLTITVNGSEVSCQHLVIATHVPLMGIKNILGATLFQTKLAGYSTYAVSATVEKNVVPWAC
jgi:glycine/D-amino acid oxidase-like deaminating enzyme